MYMYTHTYIHIFIYIYVHIYICIYTYIYITHMYTYMDMCIYIYIHVHVHTYLYAIIFIYIYVNIHIATTGEAIAPQLCAYIDILLYIFIYIYTYMYIYVHRSDRRGNGAGGGGNTRSCSWCKRGFVFLIIFLHLRSDNYFSVWQHQKSKLMWARFFFPHYFLCIHFSLMIFVYYSFPFFCTCGNTEVAGEVMAQRLWRPSKWQPLRARIFWMIFLYFIFSVFVCLVTWSDFLGIDTVRNFMSHTWMIHI